MHTRKDQGESGLAMACTSDCYLIAVNYDPTMMSSIMELWTLIVIFMSCSLKEQG